MKAISTSKYIYFRSLLLFYFPCPHIFFVDVRCLFQVMEDAKEWQWSFYPLSSLDSHLGSFAVATCYYLVLVHKLKHPLTKQFNRLSSLNLEYMSLSDAHLAVTAII